jgi:hypothetical protein
MSAQKIFLETSIQIERLLHIPERRQKILNNLRGRTVYSSSYVRMEFRRTVVRDFCFVRSIVQTDCDPDADGIVFLSNLERALSSGKGNYSPRSARRCYLVTAAILDHFEGTSVSKSELLEFLDGQIQELDQDFLYFMPSEDNRQPPIPLEIVDGTQCDVVLRLSAGESADITCSKTKAVCRIADLLNQNIGVFAEIANAYMRTPKEQRDEKMTKAIQRLLAGNFQSAGKGQQSCWPLGDAIIALEVPLDAEIYTKDRHFDVICPAVGRQRYHES